MMKVLIVDDEEALADLTKEMVERVGIYRVKTAANGEEMPLDAGQNEDAWTKNRRAHFRIVSD